MHREDHRYSWSWMIGSATGAWAGGLIGLALLLVVAPAAAQNIVTNPSFESVSVCPDTTMEPFVGYVDDWSRPTQGTSNYFNVCATDPQWGVPGGAFFSPLPQDGDAYAGFYTFVYFSSDSREYIEVELLGGPLLAGEMYNVSFWVALSPAMPWATDRIGAYFSVGSVGFVSGTAPLAYTPQVQSPVGVPMESTSWVEVTGFFVAAGGETHIVIGNFHDDAGTTLAPVPCSPCSGSSYYYIDNVSVVKANQPCVCDGDLDGSGYVTPIDTFLLSGCSGATPTGPSDPCFTADVNCDGIVDSVDSDAQFCQLGAAPDPACCGCAESDGFGGGPTPTFSFDHNSGSAVVNVPSFPAGGSYNAGGAQVLTTGDAGSPGPNPVNPVDSGATPGIMLDQPALGLTLLTSVDIDALSYGRDQAIICEAYGAQLMFSVDELAEGAAGSNVSTLGASGNQDGSADMLVYLGAIGATALGPVLDSTVGVDGSKMGLREPYQPPSPGDNLDSFDHHTTTADLADLVYFSMDANGVDPLASYIGGAALEGFSGADVLVSDGTTVSVAIPAATMGLDLSGADSDDVDALIFYDRDNSAGYSPGDTLLFSVRRGSAIVGTADSLLGVAIEPGDVLTVPTSVGLTPAIIIPAERMGLLTARTNGVTYGDELDALDASFVPEPGTMQMLLPGIGLLALRERRRRHPRSM